jgi:hypothetical protein|tara:strand:+ start:1386 stop:1817 length:432 start_codon:yes stop_codon:yes gene_type:complete
MLRVSSQSNEEDVNLASIVEGTARDSGIDADKALIEFAEAGLGDDGDAIDAARNTVAEQLGEDAMVDAAGVIANFQRMVRIADGTGIALDDAVMMLTADIREDLGINAYGGAENSTEVGTGKRIIGRLMTPFVSRLISRIAPR